MARLLLWAAVGLMGLHGLVHLMGFVAYWPLATVPELPYKTLLLGGRWEVGAVGMRIFAVLWLAAAAIFVASAVGLAHGWLGWRAAATGAVAVSTVLIALDWAAAFRGAVVNGLVLLLVAMGTWLPGALVR